MTEILFLTHNRLEYTRATLSVLYANTDWSRVRKLWLFDDRSVDGTLELVTGFARAVQTVAEVVRGTWNSPVEATADFVTRTTAPRLAKIDSDAMMPPGWLEDCERLMDQSKVHTVLGLEARWEHSKHSAPAGAARKPIDSAWVGGIVYMSRNAFSAGNLPRCVCGPNDPDREKRKYFGWQHYQEHNPSRVRAAWIRPSLQVFLLDRMPMEPWRSLGEEYVRRGWQRPAPYFYGPEWSGLWHWWQPEAVCV